MNLSCNMQGTWNLFIQLEETIFGIMNEYKDKLDDKDFNSLNKFVQEFYETMKDDKFFKSEILDKCRTH